MPRPTSRRSKRSISQDNGPAAAASKKKRRADESSSSTSSSNNHADDDADTKPSVSITDPSLAVYMEKLRSSSDLATIYAALKLSKEAIRVKLDAEEGLEDVHQLLAPADLQLVDMAGTAVGFLMCKKAIELCTLPKSLGGLAFAQAKADNIVRQLFQTMGIAACFDATTEMDLVNACRQNDIIEQQDLRKVLPKLKMIGMESRELVDQVRDELQAAKEDDNVVVQAYAV